MHAVQAPTKLGDKALLVVIAGHGKVHAQEEEVVEIGQKPLEVHSEATEEWERGIEVRCEKN